MSSKDDKIDLGAITRDESSEVAGVEFGAELIAFADAAVARSPRIGESRDAVQSAVGDAGVVDAAAIIANFQRMVRIADGTGIPLDAPVDLLSADIRHELGINEFSGATGRGKNGTIRRLAAPVMRKVAARLMKRRLGRS